ncbi:MAG TPA: DUF5615 family PIN-like protein [Xanthobacteraceae bacterium]|nr:DUF5615 family PIN-like protein [Xanthobacteraceae bacterium]
MKFLVDMPLSPTLAVWLTGQGHDAVDAVDLGLHRATDAAIMARAKQDGRTIITADLDYPRLLATAQVSEPSLILFRGGNWSEHDITTRLREVLAALTEADIGHRVRRRRLPIGG